MSSHEVHSTTLPIYTGQPTDHNSLMKNQRTVVSEFYDEIIFQVWSVNYI